MMSLALRPIFRKQRFQTIAVRPGECAPKMYAKREIQNEPSFPAQINHQRCNPIIRSKRPSL
jgi:hypothetical protein